MITLCPFLLFAFAAGTIHVPADQPTVQAAIGVAGPGDTVLVAPGTYVESLDFLGKDIFVRSSGGPLVTTLQAVPGAGAPAVSFHNGESPLATLEGFYLQESGSVTSAPIISVLGASPTLDGLRVRNTLGYSIAVDGGSPLIRSCEIHGKGIFLVRSDAEIAWCTIRDSNRGIRIEDDSSPEIHHSVIRDNGTGIDIGTGALLPLLPGLPQIHDCVFARNYFDIPNGAGIDVGPGYSAEVTGCLFLDHPNSAIHTTSNSWVGDRLVFERNRVLTGSVNFGSAVHSNDMDEVIVRGNFFAADPGTAKNIYAKAVAVYNYQQVWVEGNTVAGFGFATEILPRVGPFAVHSGGIYYDLGPWAQYGGVLPTYSAVPSTGLAGAGCVQILTPQFVDRTTRDYHLLAASPCANIGPATGSLVDVDGDPRIAPSEMGGDEIPGRSHWIRGDPLGGGTVRIVAQGNPGEWVIAGWAWGLLPVPFSTVWGDLHLDPATLTIRFLGVVGADGLFTGPGVLVGASSAPLSLHTQILIGPSLTAPRETLWGG